MVLQSNQPSGLADFRFRIHEAVGQGSTATVWRAQDTRTNHPVALKVAHDRAGAVAIAREAEALLLVDSPRIPSVIDLGRIPTGIPHVAEGMAYVALRWIPGSRLNPSALNDDQRFNVALQVAKDVSAALDDLHQAGMSHGDVKPDNIMVSFDADRCRAVLVDLGYFTELSSKQVEGATLRYIPPEFGRGPRRPAAHDLYALGICLAEIVDPSILHDQDPVSRLWSSHLPAPIKQWARSLTVSQPAARPSAAWLRDAAERELNSQQDDESSGVRLVRASYLRTRKTELFQQSSAELRVHPDAAPWLSEAVQVMRAARSLREEASYPPPSHTPFCLDPLDAAGRKRWLVALVGVAAVAWALPQPLLSVSEGKLARALERLASRQPPSIWRIQDVVRAVANDLPTRRHQQVDEDMVELALALKARPVDPLTLSRCEVLFNQGRMPEKQQILLADALRSIGQLGRAHAVLEHRVDPQSRTLRADVLRRMGKLDDAIAMARQVCEMELPLDLDEKAAAVLARALFDQGHIDQSLTIIGVRSGPNVNEVRALCMLNKGDGKRANDAIEAGLAAAMDDEQRARLLCVQGMQAHAKGQSRQAYLSFSRAAEHASRAGAVVEEATYQTGVAAAAVDAGRPAAALEASLRGSLLWEYLDEPGKQAYALLARASAYALAGDNEDAREEAERALSYASDAGDERALAYVSMLLSDINPRDSVVAKQAVKRATDAIGASAIVDDLVRVVARKLRVSALCDEDVRSMDRVVDSEGVAASVCAEWWTQRARQWLRGERVGRDRDILTRLVRLVRDVLPVGVKGDALDAARALAAKIGDGESTRVLAAMQVKVSLDLLEHVPPWLREHAAGVPWLLEAYGGQDAGVATEQVRNLEILVRALAGRESLRRLLEQALDALVLWTGVERGILLLRAPKDRLVVRAARNLERQDLQGEQLALSQSLARRALSTCEPVVAVDAAGEIADVHHSVHALGLRSVLAVPLVARGEAVGVAYLDDRVRKGAFGPQELSWVRLVAGIAAMAITDARSRLMLQREARRAKRAEQQVKNELALREAELSRAERELARGQGRPRKGFDAIVGESEPIRVMLSVVERIAAAELPVLIEGESGSGKELVARALHEHGPRAGKPFVTENCSAIPEALFESTLFGHLRGSFTGADRRRVGLFEAADGGTLFLDEVGEIPLQLQSKLLRVLQDGEVHPLGATTPKRVNVRVIAATNRSLQQMVSAGNFREDLLYRLNVVAIQVPSLRERIEDIPVLVSHFLLKHGQGRDVKLSRGAWNRLESYDWPGNVRQLENEVRRALVLCDDVVGEADLSLQVRGERKERLTLSEGTNLKLRVDALERELVTQALAKTGGNQTRAARILGVSRYGLQKMIKRLRI